MNRELTTYVKRITGALLQSGVKHVVISPGSRSTPLAYAFASASELEVHMQVDERSAGFLAVGLAKVEKEPVVLLCTSGTAAANYLPAIAEASYARIPLIVVTADRPHELREVGAPQTINQVNMYENYVKAQVDYPIAEDSEPVMNFIQVHTHRLVHLACTAPFGPVHLNIPFREPLLIDIEQPIIQPVFKERWVAERQLSESTRLQFIDFFKEEKGIFVVGETSTALDKSRFWSFALQIGWPVLVDPLSQLRSEVPKSAEHLCIDQYDALLKNEAIVQQLMPRRIVRIGAQPVSKPLLQLIQRGESELIVVDESPWFRDPTAFTSIHIQEEISTLYKANWPIFKRATYLNTWSTMNKKSQDVIVNWPLCNQDEASVMRTILKNIPNEDALFVSSSMPIRDVDTFLFSSPHRLPVYANRGANGIDGVVSSAIGVQRKLGVHTWLLIGDLAMLHDSNGLLASRYGEVNLTIIVINNDGGGIFSYLPQSTVEAHYEQLFGTPTHLEFQHLAAMYDAQFDQVTSQSQLEKVLATPKNKDLRMIEVKTNRAENVDQHRKIWKAIHEAVNQHE